jgi:uncharacterized membrane protein
MITACNTFIKMVEIYKRSSSWFVGKRERTDMSLYFIIKARSSIRLVGEYGLDVELCGISDKVVESSAILNAVLSDGGVPALRLWPSANKKRKKGRNVSFLITSFA